MAWAQVIVDLWLFEGSFGDFGSICGWSNGWINCSRVCGLSLSAMPWGRSARKLWWCMEFGWHCSVVVMMGLIICGIQLAMHGHGWDEVGNAWRDRLHMLLTREVEGWTGSNRGMDW